MTDFPITDDGRVILPREVAIKTDDPPHIVAMIEKLNQMSYTADEFVKIVASVDAARLAYHGGTSPDLAPE